jgi:mannitol-1-phosphate 5-dehydrogenase
MKKAIVYGAGNIGRGFLGQLLFESDYEIVFIDANKDLVNLLQREKKYPIRIVNNEGYTEVNVEHIKAIHSSETAMIIDEIATADIIFTSVGANILSIIAGPIAAGLCRRWDNGNMNPINLVLCENLFDADKKMEAYVKNAINRLCTSMGYTELIDNLVGFVIASIGRMVPVMSTE